jgi:cystathionine gamma-synthase
VCTVTIISRQPPGGRCSLYLRYAQVLSRYLGGEPAVRHCDGATAGAVPPPALLIGPTPLVPSDGVILSPQDIAAALAQRLPAATVAEMQAALEEAQERWMQEWAHA